MIAALASRLADDFLLVPGHRALHARPDDVPHDFRALELGDWFACDFPERRYDPERTVFLSDCYPCRLAMRAAAVNGVLEAERVDDDLLNLVRLSTGWGTT